MDTPDIGGVHGKDASQVHRFFDDVEDLLRRLTPLDDERVTHIRARVENSLASAREATDRHVKQAVEGTTKAARATDNYVHERPWQALMLAGITGIAVAMLVTPRRES